MLQTIIVTLAVRVNEIHWLVYASFIALDSHIQQYIKMMKTNLTCYTHTYIYIIICGPKQLRGHMAHCTCQAKI